MKIFSGVIGEAKDSRSSDTKMISVSRYNYNVTVLWQAVDVREIYQIYRSGNLENWCYSFQYWLDFALIHVVSNEPDRNNNCILQHPFRSAHSVSHMFSLYFDYL